MLVETQQAELGSLSAGDTYEADIGSGLDVYEVVNLPDGATPPAGMVCSVRLGSGNAYFFAASNVVSRRAYKAVAAA